MLESRKNIKIVCLLCVVLVGLCLYGCDSKENDEQKDTDKGERNKIILVVVKTLDNDYFAEMTEGFNESFKNLNIPSELIVRSGASEGDVDGQRQILDAFFNKYVRGRDDPIIQSVILTPSASGSPLVPSIKRFRDYKIPVVIVDTRIEKAALETGNTSISAFIASSNRDGGRKAGEFIINRTRKNAQILLLNGLDGHETAEARRKGFYDAVLLSKGIEVVERTCDWERSLAKSTVESLLRSGRKFDAIFGANDQMALGALEACKQQGINLEEVIIVGFDAINEAKDSVLRGELDATVAQNPIAMGYQALEIAWKLSQGVCVKKEIIIDVELYSGQ